MPEDRIEEPRPRRTDEKSFTLSDQPKRAILRKVRSSAREVLDLPAGTRLPSAVDKALLAELDRISDRHAKTYLYQTLSNEVSASLKGKIDIGNIIASVAEFAAETSESIVNNPDFIKSLEESAKIQKAKFDAYVAAGFTVEQAFRLLEAEIYSKAELRLGG